MLPQKLDITFALKAISLMPELSSADKRVGVAILDHFNRKTAQCDPSIQRLAWLLGLDERTVKSSVKKLDRLGLVEKARHGGRMLRNSYRPNWLRFRQLEAEWNERFKAAAGRYQGANTSPNGWRGIHFTGGETNTQTNPINQSKETCCTVSGGDQLSLPSKSTGCEQQQIKEMKKSSLGHTGQSCSIRYREAAWAAAERRWTNTLNRRLAAAPNIHAAVLDVIDDKTQSAATERELAQRGGGLAYILDELRKRNVPLTEAKQSASSNGKSD